MINVSESASDWQAQCASDWKQIQHLHVRLNLQSVTGLSHKGGINILSEYSQRLIVAFYLFTGLFFEF